MQFGVEIHRTMFLLISGLRRKMQNDFVLALYVDQKEHHE